MTFGAVPSLMARKVKLHSCLAVGGYICYYLSEECYRNGTRAYLKLHPTAKYQSAKASASRLLKKPSVKQAMKHKLEKMEDVKGC